MAFSLKKVKSLDIVAIVKSLIGLIALLGILVALLLYKPKKRVVKKEQSVQEDANKELTFEMILKLVRDREATSQQLEEAVDTLLKKYSKIPPKHGIRVDDAFYAYAEIMVRLCRHPNVTKDIILKYDMQLGKLNPEYKKEIEDAFEKGMRSRGL